jgi:hypothetical protein
VNGDETQAADTVGPTFRVLGWSGVSVDGRPIDYPRAWQIARAAPMDEHHPRCSYRQCSGGMLCDCPVLTSHPEYVADDEDGEAR